MRQISIFLVLFLFSLGVANGQDTISNPGFEVWNNMGTYNDVAQWTTLNPLSSGLGVIVATKTTAMADVHSGSAALKLQSKSVAGSVRPSLLTTGTVNILTNNIDGGKPINSRPEMMGGWFKYAPVGIDTASFAIYLYKGGVEIGSGEIYVSSAVPQWTNFMVPVTYSSSDIPDTVKIIIVSSSNTAPQLNTALFLDDLYYSFTTSIEQNDMKQLSRIFPNPATASVSISVEENMIGSILTFSDISGKKVMNEVLSMSNVLIPTNDLVNGIYFINISNGGKTSNHKLVISK